MFIINFEEPNSNIFTQWLGRSIINYNNMQNGKDTLKFKILLPLYFNHKIMKIVL